MYIQLSILLQSKLMILQANGQELRDFKVRLENILLMTDLKEPSYIIVSIVPDSD